MKKSLFFFVFLVASLASCETPFANQIEFHRESNSEFKIITLQQAYERVITNPSSSIITLGDVGCGNCDVFKSEAPNFVKDKSISLFYVELNSVTVSAEDIEMLKAITTFNDPARTYEYPYGGVPTTYVFSSEALLIAFAGNNIKTLRRMIKVVD